MTSFKKPLSPPSSTNFVDPKTGAVKPEWRLWLNKIYERTGGAEAPTNNDLAEGNNSNTEEIKNLSDRLTADEAILEDVKNQTTNNYNSILALNDTVINQGNEITDLQDSLNSSVGDINDEIGDIQGDITTINTSLAGKIDTVANVGTGAGVYKSKTGTTVNLKTLKAGTNITLDTTNPDEIAISASGGGGGITAVASVGSGTAVYKNTASGTANIKSLKAGTNITLDNTTNPDEIIITASGGGSATTPIIFDLTIVDDKVYPLTTGLFTVAGGSYWPFARLPQNSNIITVPNYSSSSTYAYLIPNSKYYIYFDYNSMTVKTEKDPSGSIGGLGSTGQLLFLIETDTTKISKVTDYRPLKILLKPGMWIFADYFYTSGPRTYSFTPPMTGNNNQQIDSSLMSLPASNYPRTIIPYACLLAGIAEHGYTFGEEADYITNDGTGLWGKPLCIESNQIKIFQGTDLKIWSKTTNTWVTPSSGQWFMTLKVKFEYH